MENSNLNESWYAVVVHSPRGEFIPVTFTGFWNEKPQVRSLEEWDYWSPLFLNLPNVRANRVYRNLDQWASEALPVVLSQSYPTLEAAKEGMDVLEAQARKEREERGAKSRPRNGKYLVKSLTTGDVYPSAEAAAEAVGGSKQNISAVCTGLREKAYGQVWVYLDRETGNPVPPMYSEAQRKAVERAYRKLERMSREDVEAYLVQHFREFVRELDPANTTFPRSTAPDNLGKRTGPNKDAEEIQARISASRITSSGNPTYRLVDLKIDLELALERGDLWGPDGAARTYLLIRDMIDPWEEREEDPVVEVQTFLWDFNSSAPLPVFSAFDDPLPGDPVNWSAVAKAERLHLGTVLGDEPQWPHW